MLAREDLGFIGEILSTELTAELSALIMYDAQRINESEVAKYKSNNNEKCKTQYLPYYSKEHVADVMSRIRCYSYEKPIKLSDNLTLTFLSACHISGASMIYLEYTDDYKTHTLLYSGDITYSHSVERPFTKKIKDCCLKVDTLILESTYGERDKVIYENENPVDFLERVITEEVVNKNQTLWLPSFAIGRATSLYLYLYEIFERNKIIKSANIPVYFCGQMMCDAHRIIGKDKYNEYYDEIWHNKKDIFKKEPFGFLTQKKDVEHFCLNNSRKIVISSSGMFDKGYSAILADSYVSNKKVSCLACGYQGEGTLGYYIREGFDRAEVNGKSKKIKTKFCGTVNNMSGHATHDGLIGFVKSLNQNRLKNIILVHGVEKAKQELKEDLEEALSSNKNIHIIKQFETLKF